MQLLRSSSVSGDKAGSCVAAVGARRVRALPVRHRHFTSCSITSRCAQPAVATRGSQAYPQCMKVIPYQLLATVTRSDSKYSE